MVVNVHILYLFSHCVLFELLVTDFIVILHVRLIRVLLKINKSITSVEMLPVHGRTRTPGITINILSVIAFSLS